MSVSHTGTGRRAARPVVLAAVLAASFAGCSESGDGPRRKLCGTMIGNANVAALPWYMDITNSTGPVKVPAVAQGIWVQLSHDCSHGAADVKLPVGIAARDTVRASNGETVAMFLSASGDAAPGDLEFTGDDHQAHAVRLELLQVPPPSSAHS